MTFQIIKDDLANGSSSPNGTSTSNGCTKSNGFNLPSDGFELPLDGSRLPSGGSKLPSKHTIKANLAVYNQLRFDNEADFHHANKNLLLQDKIVTIKDKSGNVVWDLEEYKKFIKEDSISPLSVNPSLWRNAKLNMINGLFKVCDGIYQVRAYDLSNITFIRGKTGWIVYDCLMSEETAEAALALINRYFDQEDLKVVALLYSHSHLDHFAGSRGLVDPEDLANNKIDIIAPEGFVEHAVSENVIAGNAMGRRATYMYGHLLPKNEYGNCNSGLGLTIPNGTITMLTPTDSITETGAKRVVDGVAMVFQFTPGSEAPTEMNTWFPKQKALWMAENTVNTMHNILSLRGAQVRDAQKWSHYINETIETWGDKVQVKFQSHHWPLWGKERIIDYLKKQRDFYKYLHDQSVRLMNMGYIGSEISEMIKLPKSLEENWPTRGYYGTLRHNSRAVYQFYMGWYSGNPSDLNNLPPEAAAKKYVEYIGGEKAVIRKAHRDFEDGNYRWVAEVLKHVVFANPDSADGKELLADAYEQLGYQSEAGPWRSEYLQGASELRNGVPEGVNTASPDIIEAMPLDMLWEYLGVHLNPDAADGEEFTINVYITDLPEEDSAYTLTVENSVLNYSTKMVESPDARMIMKKSVLDSILLGTTSIIDAIKNHEVHVQNKKIVCKFLALFDSYDLSFNIVTP